MGASVSADDQQAAASDSALQWLAVVDAGQYGESWFQAASIFRNVLSKEQWIDAMRSARAPLGKVVTRKLTNATYATKLPNAPPGEYVILQYESSFQNAPAMIETVTPTLEKNGRWRVSGYFIKHAGG